MASFDLSGTYTKTTAIYEAVLSYNAAHATSLHGKRGPSVPKGYELVFESNAANNAPGVSICLLAPSIYPLT